jgi:hypothetical protein
MTLVRRTGRAHPIPGIIVRPPTPVGGQHRRETFSQIPDEIVGHFE